MNEKNIASHNASPSPDSVSPALTPMEEALQEAQKAGKRGEVPVGAVLLGPTGELLARSGNRIVELKDPTAHAEILVLREGASKFGSERLLECDLYVTLEPCTMCAGAISFARIRRLYFGADDPKGGGVDNGVRFFEQPTCHHRPDVYGGICAQEASHLLKDFFAARRGDPRA